ncbi:unnamed protein product [Bathycoccus prasinos]
MGVTTRSRKRKVGQRDVWDLIVKNDDLSFKHILPRLNGTDLKFLYEVNTETRVLIKRSSRKRELKKKFNIGDMSSISTFCFCERVAYTKLELLKWIREEKKCDWNLGTINVAARIGNLEMVNYCVAKESPINGWACANAAAGGHLETLKYLHEEAKAPWDSWTARCVAESGHLHILEYLVECKFDKYSEWVCTCAAESGHLDCLKYLHETAKAPWDCEAVYCARMNNQIECLRYLLDNNCPLPPGWRYERGELHNW